MDYRQNEILKIEQELLILETQQLNERGRAYKKNLETWQKQLLELYRLQL